MAYNPNIHHRRSVRLQGYDYSQAGLYFITICTHEREYRFGNIKNDEMVLSEIGMVAYNEWAKLPTRFPNFELDVFQIMPNHMHGIIALVGAGFTPAQNNATDKTVRAGFTPSLDNNSQLQNVHPEINTGQPQGPGQPQGLPLPNTDDVNRAGVNPAPTIGNIVGAYKSLVANACLEIFKSKNETMGKLWQRNYHEHIIRNEQSYQTISEYIINNPAKWKDDKFHNQ